MRKNRHLLCCVLLSTETWKSNKTSLDLPVLVYLSTIFKICIWASHTHKSSKWNLEHWPSIIANAIISNLVNSSTESLILPTLLCLCHLLYCSRYFLFLNELFCIYHVRWYIIIKQHPANSIKSVPLYLLVGCYFRILFAMKIDILFV